MSEVVMFHHALGLTAGCQGFAETLHGAGHKVHTPDLFEGRLFETVESGVEHVHAVGFEALIGRAQEAVRTLPAALVYLGFSMGVMPAQMLTQTRPGARAAILCYAVAPIEEFGGKWPSGVPLQMHSTEADALGDVPIARQVADTVPEAELFLYPGDRHLFADDSTADFEADSAALMTRRVLDLLARVG